LLLYYITDRSQFPGDEATRRLRLLDKIAEAARCGVDFIQLREKDLSARDLESLARAVRENQLRTENRQLRTALLINSRTDIALAVGADGVHLRSDDILPSQTRAIWAQREPGRVVRETVSVSCHTPEEVARAAADHADFAVFGPIFGKQGAPTARATGLEALRQACLEKIPVLALGGITLENVQACLQAGAAGVAAIRLFQNNDIHKIVAALRGSS
jgi:thiamine-phosphate pyrophosphorylase